jgi:hypothetical protein
VLDRCTQGATTFGGLLARLPGIYPSEVLFSLRRLQRSAAIPDFDVLAVELEAASKPALQAEPVEPGRRLIEHPLDFEWCFTRQGVARICLEIERSQLKAGAEILCLGCPSVYLLGKQNLKSLRFRVWDKNIPQLGQMEEAREVCRVDITEATPPCQTADVVVIDPPWYNEFYRLFIWAGFHCLPLGGHILLSFPPQGTRPSAAEDLNCLIKWSSSHGLKLESRQPGCLPYRSPLFEVNALKAQGISNVPLNWRKGDLIVLSKLGSASFAKPDCTFPSGHWEEAKVGHSRIKIQRGKGYDGGMFGPVGDTDVLPSVSSRHRQRHRANVVTSGNRFIRTSMPDEVFCCLGAVEACGPDAMTKAFVASRNPMLMRRVVDLISKEEMEAWEYFRRIHEF